MSEGDLLLALMRRIRRRRRWIAAAEGGVIAGTAAAVILTAAVLILNRLTGGALGAGQVSAALVTVVVGGAALRASRPISLASCARAVDRAATPTTSIMSSMSVNDDLVLAAVSLVESGRTATPFVHALTIDAVARARGVSPGSVVPPPAPRALAFGVGAVAGLVVAGLVPLPHANALARTTATAATAAAVVTNVPSGTTTGARIRMPPSSLDAELDEAWLAGEASHQTADPESARLADEFRKIIADLAGDGLEATVAVSRVQALADEAKLDAEMAMAAKAAGRAARATIAQARDVGSDGAALAAAIDASADPTTDPAGAAAAAGRLALRHGPEGRTALGRTAGAAAAALARAQVDLGSSAAPGAGDGGGQGDENTGGGDPEDQSRSQSPRRLARQSDATSAANASTSKRRPPSDNQRHLEQLRRDLDETAASCRRDPERCQRRAEDSGRALSELQRQGRTAEGRTRLSEAVGQLLDRISRSGVAAGDLNQLRRFARSARGLARTQNGAGVGAGVGATRPANTGDPRGQGAAAAQDPGEGAGDGSPVSGSGGPPSDDEAGLATGDDQSSDGNVPTDAAGTESTGASFAGAGIGSEPGGPVLGPRTLAGGRAGRDAPAALRSDGTGPSRAEIIGGAAARGFAATVYRQVFADYRAAVEESLDATAVPPGRRYLVRRYFQLIRPRSP